MLKPFTDFAHHSLSSIKSHSRRLNEKLIRWTERSDLSLVTFVAILVALLVVYVTHTANPMVSGSTGWFGWWDQSKYLESATAFANGNLSSQSHWYPIGFSLLAAPFVKLGLTEPFMLISFASAAAYVSGIYAILRTSISRLGACVSLIFGLCIPFFLLAPHPSYFPFLTQMAVPWNTSPVAACAVWIMVLIDRIAQKQANRHSYAIIGVLVAMVAAIRPSDVVFLAPAALSYFVSVVVRDRNIQGIINSTVGLIVIIGPVLLVHLAIHNGLSSPYSGISTEIGFSGSDLHERAFAFFVDAAPFYEEPFALMKVQPWLYAVLPLTIIALLGHGKRLWCIALSAGMSIGLYLSYNDFSPLNTIRFQLIHYLVWTLPILAGLCWAGIATIRTSNRRYTIGFCASLLTLLFVTFDYKPRELTPEDLTIVNSDTNERTYVFSIDNLGEVDAIDFLGSSTDDWTQLTVTRFIVELDGRPLEQFNGYRTFTTAAGVRMLFNQHVKGHRLTIKLAPVVKNQPDTRSGLKVLRFEASL